ncbi:hypothetical protein BpHYR1_025100 [Brachionus plicatilis]|uniref:Uncharacterized protein n=1 Tax=Brachionus plicatilis TaxID=10195 RepID=A0A3M7RGE9_BRAPC|nr:hypothetical protein BpHYR1_025100 [Brachionus plicatilis]
MHQTRAELSISWVQSYFNIGYIFTSNNFPEKIDVCQSSIYTIRSIFLSRSRGTQLLVLNQRESNFNSFENEF